MFVNEHQVRTATAESNRNKIKKILIKRFNSSIVQMFEIVVSIINFCNRFVSAASLLSRPGRGLQNEFRFAVNNLTFQIDSFQIDGFKLMGFVLIRVKLNSLRG